MDNGTHAEGKRGRRARMSLLGAAAAALPGSVPLLGRGGARLLGRPRLGPGQGCRLGLGPVAPLCTWAEQGGDGEQARQKGRRWAGGARARVGLGLRRQAGRGDTWATAPLG